MNVITPCIGICRITKHTNLCELSPRFFTGIIKCLLICDFCRDKEVRATTIGGADTLND